MSTPNGSRRYLHTVKFRREHPSARAFLAPRQERPAKVQHPKPVKGSA